MSPFPLKQFDLAKLDVLEAKFNIYEDLSRQMIDKLEMAVDKISEANNKIATILTKHDERIDQTIRNDELFLKEIDQLRNENKEDYNRMMKRMEKLETKMDDFVKFRWVIVGAVAIVSFIFTISTQSSIVVDILNPNNQIERSK